jgi:hypothetical protein
MGHDAVFYVALIMALANLLPLGFLVGLLISSCRSR